MTGERSKIGLLDLLTLSCFAITAIYLIVSATPANWSIESVAAGTVFFPPFWVGCISWCISSR
jgi:hypothetical protein